jgi:hypothetical protein
VRIFPAALFSACSNRTTARYIDNCQLIFPSEPNITVVTSPTGQYVVSLQHPHAGPKILIDTSSGSEGSYSPDLYNLYAKTQQRVAEIIGGMKSSVPAARKSVVLTPPPSGRESAASSLSALPPPPPTPPPPPRLGTLPFPRFPVHPRPNLVGAGKNVYELPPRAERDSRKGREDRCCSHENELSEERSRRRKAERRVKELEATLKVMLGEMRSIKRESENEEGEDVDVETEPREKPLVEKKKDGARHVEEEPRDKPPAERKKGGVRHVEFSEPSERKQSTWEMWFDGKRSHREEIEGAKCGGEEEVRESEEDDGKFEMLEYP